MPLVIAMMALTLLTGLGSVLVLGTVTETAIAASYREGIQAFHAAEAAAEFAVRDLAAASDWEAILTGEATSSFVDGPPGGTRPVGAATIDLTEATREINTLAAAAAEDPPSYGLYAYGWFADLLQIGPVPSPIYVAVWIADLSSEGAGDPPSPVVGVVGRAYGPTGSRRSIAVSVTRTGAAEAPVPASIHMLSWAELR